LSDGKDGIELDKIPEASKLRLKFLEHMANLSVPDSKTTDFTKKLEADRESAKGSLKTFVQITLGGWMLVVVLLLFLQGFQFCGFHLGDGVLIAAIGATAIFGLMMIILKHYFPSQ
jgi:hypothetical protein